MARKPVQHRTIEVEEPDVLEEAYESFMEDVYDILMEAYDKVGVKTQDFMAEISALEDEDNNVVVEDHDNAD